MKVPSPRSAVTAIVRRRTLLTVLLTGIGVFPWLAYVSFYDVAWDAHAYFQARAGSLYGAQLGVQDAYLYSPAFSQLIEPLRWLGWDGFRTSWRLLELGAMTAMAGPLTGALLFAQPFSLEFNMGNIHLLTALAVVVGFRFPATWSFVLLTKVTPGVGLLWFVARREWRNLIIALGTTAAIAAVSFLLAPDDWLAWFQALPAARQSGTFYLTTLPLPLRLIGAAALVWWGARRGYRWTVLAAVLLAQPAIWQHALSMTIGFAMLRLGPFWLGNADAGLAPPARVETAATSSASAPSP